jgi:IS5 family transposase
LDFGVNSRSRLIHAVATPANFADSTVLPRLLHGNATRVGGDQAYRGQRAVIRQHASRAQDFVNRRYRFVVSWTRSSGRMRFLREPRETTTQN